MSRIKYYFLIKMARLMYIGFHKSNSEETNVKIIFFNILNFSCLLNQFLATFLYLFVGVYNSAIYSLLLLPVPVLIYYVNYKRKYLLSKLFIFTYYNAIIFVTSCYFSHPYLSYYYIPVIIGSAIVFNTKELKYLLLINFLSFSLLIIENTSLSQYIPHLYQDKNHEKTTIIVLAVHVNFILGLLFMYAYYMRLKMKRLIKLNKTLKEAKTKLKNQSEDYLLFSEASSHFLKSPIHVFNTFIGKIEQGIDENKSYEELKPYFSVIKKNIDQEEKFINNMFDYNKIILTVPQKKSHNLTKILTESLESFKKNKSDFEYFIDSQDVILKTDVLLLNKITTIIAENAYCYNKSQIKSLKIIYSINKSNLTINFIDNGVGINEADRENIFKSYIRINSIDNVKGIGIGLLKAKKAAELINAQIVLAQSSDSGTTFQLIINTNK
ncbi:sensor histidine kinase [Chryseobacterium binzhouense]|uniref:sensor histidine kinase n=1 Tax=Chryseobacterium binzhouense TaxID=2593646 RepID=UPI0016287FA4|nr:HAMP domain-containing sensor histidine kinase [Chryseobacterium binzhouense]